MTPLQALELIASPMRSDGTWNRDREACRQLAVDALARHNNDLGPQVVETATNDPAPEFKCGDPRNGAPECAEPAVSNAQASELKHLRDVIANRELRITALRAELHDYEDHLVAITAQLDAMHDKLDAQRRSPRPWYYGLFARV